MKDVVIANLVIDTPTASWVMERVHDDGLMANVSIGFPYMDGGVRVCAVRLDYAVDADNEVSRLLAIASERASRFSMKQNTPVLEGNKSTRI